ncbi:MAG TPA: glycosyltransferase family 87 protein [Planctomycetota bacterium]|nr:glycosyltransferase family 87 protein [Planctomycetota bacterium]
MGTVVPRWSPQRRWVLFWIVVAVVLVVRAGSRPESRGVILDHLEFGRRLLHGENVYGPWQSDPDAPLRPLHAPYPPSFGLLTAPFALIDEVAGRRAARLAWALLQVASLFACGLVLRALLAKHAPPPERARWQWTWLATFVLLARFVLRDTHGGGGNLINTALVLLALHDAENGRERRAGAWLAISLVTKPTMVWLLPVFALFGRWRALIATAAACALALLATFALQRFELAPWLRWLQGSWALATQADPWAVPAFDFPPFEWMNQALRFLVARWTGEVPAELAQRVAWGVTPGFGAAAAAVAWFVRAASAAALLAVLAAAWRARHDRLARTWVVAAVLVLTLLLSPISWKAHHVALLPVLLMVWRDAIADRARGARWLLAIWFVVVALPGRDLFGAAGDDVDEWLNSLYVVTLGDVALLVYALAQARSAAQEHRDAAVVGCAAE